VAKLQIGPSKNYNVPDSPKCSSVLWTGNNITLNNIFYLNVIIIENDNLQKEFEWLFMITTKTKWK